MVKGSNDNVMASKVVSSAPGCASPTPSATPSATTGPSAIDGRGLPLKRPRTSTTPLSMVARPPPPRREAILSSVVEEEGGSPSASRPEIPGVKMVRITHRHIHLPVQKLGMMDLTTIKGDADHYSPSQKHSNSLSSQTMAHTRVHEGVTFLLTEYGLKNFEKLSAAGQLERGVPSSYVKAATFRWIGSWTRQYAK